MRKTGKGVLFCSFSFPSLHPHVSSAFFTSVYMLCPTPTQTHTRICITVHTHSHSLAPFFPPPLPWKGWRRWWYTISASPAWTSHPRTAAQGSPDSSHAQLLPSKADCKCPWSTLEIWGNLGGGSGPWGWGQQARTPTGQGSSCMRVTWEGVGVNLTDVLQHPEELHCSTHSIASEDGITQGFRP